jgi:hypothetical protein
MEDQHLKADVGVDGNQPAPDNDLQQDLDVVDADEVKGGASRIHDGTSNTLMVGERF